MDGCLIVFAKTPNLGDSLIVMSNTVHSSVLPTLEQSFSVDYSFPVLFTRGLFHPGNRVLADACCRLGEKRRHRVMVLVDGGVAAALPELTKEIEAWFAAQGERMELVESPRIVPGGEAVKKQPKLVFEIIQAAMEHKICRHSFVVAIGGGAVLDMVGMAAALFHRGVRLVRVPTTVLSQNDAGVGVKNGINLEGVKNAIGTFCPPFAVINDLDFLRSLPDVDWIGGIAEAFKVAIIQDAKFFATLCQNATRLRERDEKAMEPLVWRCADLHLRHIRGGGDPFEFGQARPLDFGHWSAHRLETISENRIRHGQAVAAGIAVDSVYAHRAGWLKEEELEAILRGLEEAGFPLWYPEFAERDAEGRLSIMQGLEDFREHLGGELTVTFPLGIGRRHEVHEVDLEEMERAFEIVRKRSEG